MPKPATNEVVKIEKSDYMLLAENLDESVTRHRIYKGTSIDTGAVSYIIRSPKTFRFVPIEKCVTAFYIDTIPDTDVITYAIFKLTDLF